MAASRAWENGGGLRTLSWRGLETELWCDRGDAHLQGVVAQTGLRPGHVGFDRGREVPHRKLSKAIAVVADGRLGRGEIGIVGIQHVLRPFLTAGGVFLQDALLRCLGLRPFRRGALHGRIRVGLGLFCFPHLPLELIARRAGPPGLCHVPPSPFLYPHARAHCPAEAITDDRAVHDCGQPNDTGILSVP